MRTRSTIITRLLAVLLFLPLATRAQTPDPVWATYSGGTLADLVTDVAVDAAGNIYVCGYTASTSGIALGASVHDNTHGGGTGYDAFVMKYSPTGQKLWGTYCGGSLADQAMSIETDGTSVYISGQTASTTGIAFGGGAYTTYGGGTDDGFIAKFNASNGAGIWGTYYGDAGDDYFYDLALASNGDLLLCGTTTSANTSNRIASAGAMKTAFSGGTDPDAMLVKFNANGARLWGTYMGTSVHDGANAVAVDASGTVYMGGNTTSTTDIATTGVYQESYLSGTTDGYLMAINSTGTAKIWGTYWGGSQTEIIREIGMGPDGNLVVSGLSQSTSTGLATPGSYQPNPGGGFDAFVGKFSTSGQRLWGTYFGGALGDGVRVNCVDLDEDGNIYMLSDGGPNIAAAPSDGLATNCSLQPVKSSTNGEMVITKLSNDGTTKVWSSYYGTTSHEFIGSMTYIGNGRFIVGGATQSTAFPVTAGAAQSAFGGTTDGLLTMFSDGRAPALTMMPSTLAPMSQSACALGIPQVIVGNAVGFNTTATYYTSPVFYQWQVADAAAGPWTDMAGEMFKDLQPLASQTDKYYRRLVLVDNGACTRKIMDSSAVASVSINANVAPIANADGPQWYVCGSPNNTVTLNGSAGGGTAPYSYQWFVGSATTAAVATAAYTPTVTANTTYTLRVTDAAGCVDVDQTTVVPALANAGPDKPACQGSGGVQIGTAPVASPSVAYSWSIISGTAGSLSCTGCAQPIASPAAATTYRVTVTVTRKDGSTCSSFDDVVVTPVAPPNGLTNFAGTDKTICAGSTVVLGGASAGSGFTYTWTPGQYLSTTTTYNPTFNAGTVAIGCSKTYQVTAASGGCTFTDEVKVSMVDPTINDQNQTICGPAWVQGGNNCGTATYSWSVLSGTGSVLQTANGDAGAYLYSPGGNTTFRRTVTLNGVSCTADVTVNGACGNGCNLDIAVSGTQGCPKVFGSAPSFTLSATGVDTSDYNFSWSPASMVSNPYGAKVTVTSSSYATLTLTATNKYNSSLTCSDAIAVNDPTWALPVFATTDKNTCPNTGIAIGNPTVAGYTYLWVPATGLNSATVSNPVASIPGTASYSYTVTETATGCRTTGDVAVNVVPLVANAGNDRAVCNGATVTLGTAPPVGTSYTYSWQPGNAAWTNGTDSADAQPQVLFAGSNQTFTLTVSDSASGCSATDDVTLSGTVLPGEYAGAAPAPACPGESVQLGRAAEALATYQWTLSNNNPATGLSCTTCSNPVLTAPDATTVYKVTVSYPGCSTPVEDLVTVTVKTAPAVTLIDKSYCPTAAVAIGFGSAGNPAAPANVSSYLWAPSTGLSSTSVENPTTTVKVETNYLVTVTYTNGCVRTDSVKVTPTATADAKPDIMMCSGQSAQVGSPAVAGMSYSWSGGPFVGSSTVAQPIVNPATTTTYTVSVTASGCTITDQVLVTVNTPANFDITGNTAICEGGVATVGLTAAAAANTIWQWSPLTGVADPTNPNTTIAAPDTMTYRLTQTSINTGCSNYKEVVIVVSPNNISALAPDTSVCAGVATSLSVTVTPSGTYQYLWSPGTGLSDPNAANPAVTTSFDRTYTVTVTDNVSKCQQVDTVNVTMKPEEACYPPVTLSGNVFHDANALKDASVNSTSALALPSGLYASLLDTSGAVVNTVSVAANGTYTFGITPAGAYTIVLHQNPAGSASPGVPAGWMNTGEYLGTGAGSDAGINGTLIPVTVQAVNVTNANFGVQQPPVSDPKSYLIDLPTVNQVIPLDGTHISTGPGTSTPGQLTGNDPEDGTMNGSTLNRIAVITTLPANGELWYNGALVTAGQRISNYNASLLSFKATGGGYISVAFQYAYVDAAGVESAPVTYALQWGLPLPVSLVAFGAAKAGSTALLSWKTANEENVASFRLERSSDGTTWTSLETVKAAGSGSHSYQHTDVHPLAGTNYYRLALVSSNGSYRLSPVRRLDFGNGIGMVSVVPNPARSSATVVFGAPVQETLTLKLLGSYGQLVTTAAIPAGTARYPLVLDGLARGVYYLNIEGAAEQVHLKLIVQ